MAVLFDPKGGTDRVATGASVDTPADWSAYFWVRRGSTTAAQFFSLGAGALIDVYISSSTTDRLNIDRVTSGTKSEHNLTAANDGITYSASQWVFVAMTQSGRNVPVFYTASPVQGVALGTRTATTLAAGSGTATTTAGQVMYLGNWNGLDYALGGDLAYFGFHNVILTAGEIEEAMQRGMTLRGLVLATPLESSAALYDLSGNGHTLTGTGVATTADAEPPVVPLWVPTTGGWAPHTPPADIDTAGAQTVVVDATGASSIAGNIDRAGAQTVAVDATGASSLGGGYNTTGAQAIGADATGSSSLEAAGAQTVVVDATVSTSLEAAGTTGAQTVAVDATGASDLAGAGSQALVVDATGASSLEAAGAQALVVDATGASTGDATTAGAQTVVLDGAGTSSLELGPPGDAVIRVDATGVSELYTDPGGVVTAGTQVIVVDATGASTVIGTITTVGTAVLSVEGTGASFTSSPTAPTSGSSAVAADWVWELLAFDGDRLAEVVARARRLRMALNAAGAAEFSLDTLEAADYPDLVLGQRDLMVSRNGRPLFRGPLGGARGADLTLMGGSVSFAATGIGELLADRYIPAGTELAALEAAQMAWQLIVATQALGPLGIIAGDLPDSVARTKAWDTPAPVLGAIRELAELQDGFDFAIEPDASGAYRFDVWHPRRGADRGVVLEPDRNVASVSPSWDAGPGRIANDVTAAGVDQVSVTETDAASVALYRLRQRLLSLPDADDATVLGDRARGELARDAYLRPSGTVRLLPGAPDANLDAIGLGDTVTMDYAAGWARFEGPYRVTAIEVDLPDAPGHEALALTVEPA